MASTGHIAVGLFAARLWSGPRLSWAASLGFCALSMLPDADVVAFALGIPYEAEWGHRGASHSLLLALTSALMLGGAARQLAVSRWRLLTGLCAIVLASHGLLDAMTTGGEGIALIWPWSLERIFFDWRPIPVAPIGLGMISARGAEVVLTELMLFSPLLCWSLWPRRRSPLAAGSSSKPPPQAP